MAQIGLKNLYYAPVIEDAEGNETYGTPVRLAKAINADLSVDSENASLYADDGADIIIKDFKGGKLKLDINDLENSTAAALLGAAIDDNGALTSFAEDIPPAVAVGFQSRSAKGGDRYFWLYRVVFGVPGQALKTKGESVEFSTPSIEGVISRRNKTYEGKHPWKYEIKAGDPGVSAERIAGWFAGVPEPGPVADTSLETLSIGAGTLTPAFHSAGTTYACQTETATEALAATATDENASVAIIVNGASVTNGDTYTWAEGTNLVHVIVTNGRANKTYVVAVEKS